jgi:hypothetical protein
LIYSAYLSDAFAGKMLRTSRLFAMRSACLAAKQPPRAVMAAVRDASTAGPSPAEAPGAAAPAANPSVVGDAVDSYVKRRRALEFAQPPVPVGPGETLLFASSRNDIVRGWIGRASGR